MTTGDRSLPELRGYLENARWVRALARSLLGRTVDVDDLTQDVWERALRHPGKAAHRSWLATVVRHLAVDRRRRASLRACWDGASEENRKDMAAPEVVAKAELHRRLVQAVLDLPEPYRSVVLQRWFEGLPVRRIAERTDVPYHTVRTHLQRGLEMLRQRLEREWGADWRESCGMLAAPAWLASPALTGWGAWMPSTTAVLSMALVLLAAGLLLRGNGGGRAAVAGADSSPQPVLEAGLPSAFAPAIEMDAGSHVRQELPAVVQDESDRILSGVVVTAGGLPISSAIVVVVQPLDRQMPGLVVDFGGGIEREAARAATDEQGSFAFELEPGRLYDLVVEAAGHPRAKRTFLYPGNRLRIELGDAAAIQGWVREAGSGVPLAGIGIEARPGPLRGPGDPIYQARSGADGRYRVDGMPAGFYSLRLESTEHATRTWSQAVVLDDGEERHLDLEIEKAPVVRGRITHAETKGPIAGATIRIRADLSHSATTDADGRFVLTGVPAMFHDSISVRAPGFGEYDYPLRMVPPEGLDLELGLLPGRRAIGRVVDEKGEPIAGAYLTAGASLFRSQYGDWQHDTCRARSDARGRFELTDLRVDLRHSLLIGAEGHAAAVFDFPASEWSSLEIDLGDLALEPPGSIAGQVLDLRGKPLEGLWVELSGEPARRDLLEPSLVPREGYLDGTGFGFGNIYARTDPRGRFAFTDLPSGSYFLWAGSKGYAQGAEGRVMIDAGEQREGLALELDAGLSIAGRVVDREGHPLAGMAVNVSTLDWRQVTYNFSGVGGRFALHGLDEGRYRLEIGEGLGGPSVGRDGKPRRFAPLRLPAIAAGTMDLRLVLAAAGPVSGIVLGPDGEPVGGAVIAFPRDEDGFARPAATSGPDGRFTAWIAVGEPVDLWVQAPRPGAEGSLDPMLDGNFELSPEYTARITQIVAGTNDLVFRLPRLR